MINFGLDTFRFNTPRSWDSTRETWRIVQGFRGTYGDWDWDAGLVASKASSEMDNHGRQSMTLLMKLLQTQHLMLITHLMRVLIVTRSLSHKHI